MGLTLYGERPKICKKIKFKPNGHLVSCSGSLDFVTCFVNWKLYTLSGVIAIETSDGNIHL